LKGGIPYASKEKGRQETSKEESRKEKIVRSHREQQQLSIGARNIQAQAAFRRNGQCFKRSTPFLSFCN